MKCNFRVSGYLAAQAKIAKLRIRLLASRPFGLLASAKKGG